MRSSNYSYNNLDENRKMTPLAAFMESYNKSAPKNSPLASVKNLTEFHESNPSLFKAKNSWSVDKHRKRFMDWLYSHQNDA